MTSSWLPLRSMQVTEMQFLYLQVLNPFYVFQAFTLTLWLSQGYVEYSVAIIILSVLSIVLSVYDLRQVRAVWDSISLPVPIQQNLQDFYWEQGVALLNLCHKAKSKVLTQWGISGKVLQDWQVDENVLVKSNYWLKAEWHTMFGRTLRLCLSMVRKNAVMG